MFLRIPDIDARMEMLEKIQRNSKSKGKYLATPSFADFAKGLQRKCPVYNDSIESCLSNAKNIIREIFKWANIGSNPGNKTQLRWFKSFLATAVKSVTAGLHFAQSVLHVVKKKLKPTADKFKAFAAVLSGVASAAIVLGIGLWSKEAKKILDKAETKTPLASKYAKKFTFKTSDGELLDVPEGIDPPGVQVPKISMSISEQEEPLDEVAVEAIFLLIFILFFKAAVIQQFNEEMKDRIHLLKALFTPTAALLGLLTMLILLGSGGISALLAGL